jgi:hypothetical protein
MAEGRFEVRAWLQRYSEEPTVAITVSKPSVVTFWTKQSAAAGGKFLFGDESGLLTALRSFAALSSKLH